MGDFPALLPVEQRLLCYRQFAEQALRQARGTGDRDIRAQLLDLAAGWHFLATEVEKTATRASPAGALVVESSIHH